MNLRTIRLPVGTRLYHGTIYLYSEIIGPAWFSDIRDTSLWFATDYAQDHEGVPIVYEYEVHTPVDLIYVPDEDHEEFVFTISDALRVEGFDTYDLAPLVCRAGFAGWFAAHAYVEEDEIPPGADIMICAPSRWLRRVR